MASKKSINVGIIGFGTVGTGTARILIENADIIKRRLGAPVVLKKISDLDIKRDRGIKLGEWSSSRPMRRRSSATRTSISWLNSSAATSRPRSSSSRPSRTKSTW